MSTTSTVAALGRVPFPVFTGERIYMREFTKAAGLPADLRRWQDTVDAMLDGIDPPGPVYLMVDQAPVRASHCHRRPGLHVDMYWHPGANDHGHSPWPRERRLHAEGLILAADVLGCAAYAGEFDGVPSAGGDCSHIDTARMTRVELEPGRAWAGHTMSMLHESIPVEHDCLRTVVRLNVPGWVPGARSLR